MPRGRKPKMANEAMKALPFDEADLDLAVEPIEIPGPPAEDDDLWWNGREIARVFGTEKIKTSANGLKTLAIELGLKTEANYVKGKPCRYSFTDIAMLEKELIRRAEAKKPRDSHAMCVKLSQMLDSYHKKGRA